MGNPGKIWEAVAAANRNFGINTKGTDFITVVSVWTGPNCSNLTEIACSTVADGSTPTNQLQFTSSGTNTYFIVIEGASGDAGTLKVNFKSF